MLGPHEELAGRLRARRLEIEQALLARTTGISDAALSSDPEYREGFHAAVSAAFEYSLAVVESVGDPPAIPAEILTQARLAARHRVGLDAVLRRYVAGSALLDDVILDECGGAGLQSLLRLRARALELLLHRVSAEYETERQIRCRSGEARALEQVKRLLRGESPEDADLGYDLNLNHVALAARGTACRRSIAELSSLLDSRLLLVSIDADTAWAWLGRRRPIYVEEVLRAASSRSDRQVSIGVGESAPGVAGWRQSHHQAKAAGAVAAKSATRLARYADVCLIASAMQDTLLKTSLRAMYVQPLLVGRDGGAAHLQTLRAYFAAHRNGKSTASALGISRQAVANRLRVVEERLGRPLPSCATAMEIALGLDDPGGPDLRSENDGFGPERAEAVYP